MSGALRDPNSKGLRTCIAVFTRKILWKDWVNLGLLKRRYVKPSQMKETTVNRKWETKKPKIYKAARSNFLGKEEIKFLFRG